ncbi:ribosome assembly cofactor RimP [Paludibacter sp. 221]|uniref:ribosome assembly cofactor RimP n=1 Tax=Paludibacter sp. 221 TaxID=2302939 RepID=UPI0013D198CD|nr:ribosome assembly cofactor RimP [Paludibacter sp. 221]NDV46011.1 ribosome assembly cofactor RimP [Paludibacter sp. 221]
MLSKEPISQIVNEYLSDTEYYLVDINITPDNRILIEIDSFDGVSVEFCAKLNRHIESKLDREVEDYELEVSSAGLTSPFKVKKQYEKNIGNEVEVLTKDGRKLTGVLVEADDDSFTIEIEKQVKPEGAKRKVTVTESVTFPYKEIKTTKYIFRFK